MNLRPLFVPALFAAVLLTGCGSSSSSKATATTAAPAATTTSSTAAAAASSTTLDSSGIGSADAGTACPDQTVSGYKVTKITVRHDATCGDLATVVSSTTQSGGDAFQWEANGWTCSGGYDAFFVCDKDNARNEIQFTTSKK